MPKRRHRNRRGSDTPRPAVTPLAVTTSAQSATTTVAEPPISAAALLSVGLVALTAFVYYAVRHFDFVTLDDPLYVTDNAHVLGGLTWANIGWAFTTFHAGYWIPLTWLSLMLDTTLHGHVPGLFHVTNVVLHVLGVLTLFECLRRATGSVGRSVCVAALFAVHPLHVESVAWVTERKDVLSTVFLWLMLLVYIDYTRRPSLQRYLGVAGLFVAGLMAKPMLVSAPLLLLLVDVWPLGRLSLRGGSAGARDRSRAVLLEKLPLIAIAAGFAVLVVITQQHAGAVTDTTVLSVRDRLAAALTGYGIYLRQTVWPVNLSVIYGFPDRLSGWWIATAALVMAAASFGAWLARVRLPYLLVGWLWFVISLVPVIGIVQVGMQWHADRFTYVPLVGLFVAAVWGLTDLARRANPRVQQAAALAAAGLILTLAIVSRHQLEFWRDSVAMWTRALTAETRVDDYSAHLELAEHFREHGKLDQADDHFREALRLQPDAPEAMAGLGLTLADLKRPSEAIPWLERAVGRRPDLGALQGNLGVLLAGEGRLDEALPHFVEAARLQPNDEAAHMNLALACARTHHEAEALAALREVLRINPSNVTARRLLKQ